MPCSPLNVNRRFGGIYHLHLQGRRISRARNQHEAALLVIHHRLLRCPVPLPDSTSSRPLCSSFGLHLCPRISLVTEKYGFMPTILIYEITLLVFRPVPRTLLGNGSVNTFLRQRIHKTVEELLGAVLSVASVLCQMLNM
jgi:hypothetical protein